MASTRPNVPAVSAIVIAALLAATPDTSTPAQAQAPRTPPVLDQLASPFTDSEVGGFGCLASTLATGASMTALMGGPSELAAALSGILTPRLVLEASAAGAFVFSSACYIGQVLAPVVMLGYTTLFDSLTLPPLPSGNGNIPAASAGLP